MEPESSRGRGTSALSSSSAASNTRGKPSIAQYNADAVILAQFEHSAQSGKPFNYSRSVLFAPQTVPAEQISVYLSAIQRGGLVQPFGCMLAVEESTFRVIGYSENCFQLLGLSTSSGKENCLIGIDARTLFTPPSGASLAKTAVSKELSFLNPIWVYTRSGQKPFYAILHRVDVGIVIDLEPATSSDHAFSLAGAMQSQKLAVWAISRLQSLPGGDIGVLCDTVVEDVQKLTGYDRVMVYKFHDDEHGEVVSEIRRSDLEPFLGLHYPAIDIPQAARFLFKQNRVRMICDCHAQQVRVIQNEHLKQPLCLVNSTIRSPHGCHVEYMANMGSIASLVLAIVINGKDSTKLWGLVVCHHTSPRYVPFPLRHACEFVIQAFGLQLYMEIQLAAQLAEKKILKTQTLLCDMILRDAPFGVVTQSPSLMDLVKCDGAALFYEGKCWLLGVTPTEEQVKDIAKWMLSNHGDTSELITDCLADAGYPGAASLGDAVCGVAAAKVTLKDFLFWFRSHTAKEVKWGGAKHHPENKDDGGKMNPRSSFNVFLEVVKRRSMPWEVSEINVIHSLQQIMRDSFRDMEESGSKTVVHLPQNVNEMEGISKLSSVACEMGRLIETAGAPIFGVDSAGLINGWNAKAVELTGLQVSDAIGKSLAHEIVHEDSLGAVENLLERALHGDEDKNIELKMKKRGLHQQNSVAYIVVNACTSRDHRNDIIGVCFVGQDITCEKVFMNKFIRLEGDYKAVIQSLSPLIPPIFASDENACCCEWNASMEKLTGRARKEVIGKLLPGEVFGGLCQLKGQDTLTKFMILLYQVINGQETEKFPFGFVNREGKPVEVLLTANKRISTDGNIIGCICFLQTVEPDRQRQENSKSIMRLKELAYLRQELKNPLSGIRFIHKLLGTTPLSENQKQFLETSYACERQIMTIIEDMDVDQVEDGNVELNMADFFLGNTLDAIVSQVMILVREKGIQLLHEIPEEIKTLCVYGDEIRLQLILSEFLRTVAIHTPPEGGWVEIKVSPGLKLIQDGNEYTRLQFRMTHPGAGLPSALLQDIFDGGNHWHTHEGQGLNFAGKLLNRMNGNVMYGREHNRCYFLIELELKSKNARLKGLCTSGSGNI